MKTNLLTLIALLGFTTVSVTWAQTNLVTAYYPSYTGIDATAFVYSSHSAPKVVAEDDSSTENIQIVTDYLNYLTDGQLDKAQLLLATDFQAFGSGFSDERDGSAVLNQAERDQQHFAFRTITIQRSDTKVTSDGDTWVYLAGEWTAIDKRDKDKPTRIPFHLLTQVVRGKLVTTYTSYGNDQIFYDFGFPIYQQPETRASKSNR